MILISMAMGSNSILVAAAIMALAVIGLAFHKQILGAMGIYLPKRRVMPKRRPESTRLDIISKVTDES